MHRESSKSYLQSNGGSRVIRPQARSGILHCILCTPGYSVVLITGTLCFRVHGDIDCQTLLGIIESSAGPAKVPSVPHVTVLHSAMLQRAILLSAGSHNMQCGQKQLYHESAPWTINSSVVAMG